MECWGASGGKLYKQYEAKSTGGRGGYTRGVIKLTSKNISDYPTFYVYVGQKGSDWNGPDNDSPYCPVAWNGGGLKTIYNACGGGGATDIRLTPAHATNKTVWNANLASRIMVAGAGGGANDYGFGGPGGGLTGEVGIASDVSVKTSTEGNGTGGSQSNCGTGRANGGLGYGGTEEDYDGGAGGGGYYGGGQGTGNYATGGGGSSYISGLSGCVVHSSGLKFDPAVTYSGTAASYNASTGRPTGTNTTIPDPNKVEGQLLAYNQYSVNGYARIIIKPYD